MLNDRREKSADGIVGGITEGRNLNPQGGLRISMTCGTLAKLGTKARINLQWCSRQLLCGCIGLLRVSHGDEA